MLENIDAVIFDLDGTLVDSMWVWKQIDIDYLDEKNISLPDDLSKIIEGMSFTETARYFKKRFQIEESIEEIKEKWMSMTRDYYKNRIFLKAGVRTFLNQLKSKHILMGIGTSNALELTKAVLEKNEINHFFQAIQTGCENTLGKPNPDIFLKVAKDLKVDPTRCLVFEDTYAGVLAAKRAKMKVYAIADESSLAYKEEITDLADRYIQGFEEVLLAE